MQDLTEIVRSKFRELSVVIVGDLVADQFLHGTIARVSREAPVFILSHDTTDTHAGGAANAAVNVASLGGKPILVGVAGNDTNGDLLMRSLVDSSVDASCIVRDERVRTTAKVRVLAGQQYAARQQVIRIDYENRATLADDIREKLIEILTRSAADADAIVLSDYNYGVADAAVFGAAKRLAEEHNIPLLVDSRFRLGDFAGATTATPNSDEVEQILGVGFADQQCSELREKLGLDALLITRGNKGMNLFEKDGLKAIKPIGSLEPVDVTGAGDTVIAVYALGLASGLSYFEAANLANHAGGIVVMKKSTASVTPAELIASLKTNAPLSEGSNA
jgi:rfaE bifunctional protein kinase chain/domain